MTHHLTLDVIDADGAVREAADGLDEGTRRDMLRRAGIAGAGMVAGGVLIGGLADPAIAAISTRKKSKKNDAKILNYALTLEFLEAEFYAQALANNTPNTPALRAFTEATASHEAAHVKAIQDVLGRAAIKKPTFDFKDTVTDAAKFAQTAQVLEDTGVAAYAGQGPNILQKPVVVAALAIHSVEARHAAWIRFINSGGQTTGKASPAPVAFDKALSEKKVLAAVGDTGFITG
jgi:rubrerythrin